MNEFELIARYFAPLAGDGALGLRDDAAILNVPTGYELVITKDAIVEDIHFFAQDAPADIARKLLRVNLSDLAAKGATPTGYLLALMLPTNTSPDWVQAFAQGLSDDQTLFDISLLGGDTTRTNGPLCLSLTALGTVAQGQMLRRSGAQAGDALYVSGTIGDAALFLALHDTPSRPLSPAAYSMLRQRYLCPIPRVRLGQGLRGIASASMDISDGLAQDAGHLAHASGVGLTIEAARLPCSAAVRKLLTVERQYLDICLTGGDDYELLFTAPAADEEHLKTLAIETETAITRIGTVTHDREANVEILDAQGKGMTLERTGWQHF